MKKHLTNAERESRKRAEQQLVREKRIYLRAPSWLSKNGRKLFESTKCKMRGLGLLDTLDIETLALYADAIDKYQAASEKSKDLDPKMVQVAQAWSRLALALAEKLGITPTARARLAKKKAEKEVKDEFEQLLDDVTDFVNRDDA